MLIRRWIAGKQFWEEAKPFEFRRCGAYIDAPKRSRLAGNKLQPEGMLPGGGIWRSRQVAAGLHAVRMKCDALLLFREEKGMDWRGFATISKTAFRLSFPAFRTVKGGGTALPRSSAGTPLGNGRRRVRAGAFPGSRSLSRWGMLHSPFP